jgi:YHS domain-containing protein
MKLWLSSAIAIAFWTTGCASNTGTEQASAPVQPPPTQSVQPQPMQPLPEVARPALPPLTQPRSVRLTAQQELAKYCRVCVLDTGQKMEEPLPAHLDIKHGGKTYKNCSEECKRRFAANPKRYVLK